MATVANTARLTARLTARYGTKCAPRRAYRATARSRAAQNYTMPALSPTMSEGNIASWKVKEGDSFTAGDVLLEIETDKATMDVEAQDDGVVFKIMAAEGAKAVKVGQRIAVFAEQDDDLQSLEVPEEMTSSKPESESKEQAQSQETDSPTDKQRSSGQSEELQAASPTKQETTAQQGGTPHKQQYVLFPSVEQLLHQNGYSSEESGKITGTGPNGRILKGDVLAYLGQISKDYPAKLSSQLERLAHLDLSNIQLAKKAQSMPKNEDAKATAQPELPAETEIAVPISLSAVIATQKRVQDTLGIFLPLSTFIARASELANEDLPRSRSRKPTADELFSSVLGLDQLSTSSRGHFIPQITGISTPPLAAPVRLTKKPDIIDFLAPKAAKRKIPAVVRAPAEVGISPSGNIFSVTAKMGDEARATQYLERMKLALEKEPGRLVL